MSVLEKAGLKEKDGPSAAVVAKAIEAYKKANKDPDTAQEDLSDVEKYGDWQEQLLYGTISSGLETLDIPAPALNGPVVDPSFIAESLPEYVNPLPEDFPSTPVPVTDLAVVLVGSIKPEKLVEFPDALAELIASQEPPGPPEPTYPEVEILPTTFEPSYGGEGQESYPSQEGFNLAVIGALPEAQSLLDGLVLADPTLAAPTERLFETARQTLEATIKAKLQAETSDPSGLDSDVAVCVNILSEAQAIRTVASTTGATKLLEDLAKFRGYKPEDKVNLDDEAEQVLAQSGNRGTVIFAAAMEDHYPKFYETLMDFCLEYDLNPLDFLRVGVNETGLNNTKINTETQAAGIWQMTPQNILNYGPKGAKTPEKFAKLEAHIQLTSFIKFFKESPLLRKKVLPTKEYKPLPDGVEPADPIVRADVYKTIFLPFARVNPDTGVLEVPGKVNPAGQPDFTTFTATKKGTAYYNQNFILDENFDGRITMGDLGRKSDYVLRDEIINYLQQAIKKKAPERDVEDYFNLSALSDLKYKL